jgi:hypothetical protein
LRRKSTNGLPPWSDNPPNARWLIEWQRKSGYSDMEASAALGISLSTFRRQRSGRSPVSEQTARLALYVTIHRLDWLSIAELAAKLARTERSKR